MVPSTIFNRACWTPSPETSLVMLGFSVFARNLVDFIYVYYAAACTGNIIVRVLQKGQNDVFHILANITCFSQGVASAIAKGTLRILASVWARSVLPEPVGPINRILLF